MIEQLVMCWLRLQYIEYIVTYMDTNRQSYDIRGYWDRAHTQALRRYTRACEGLARVRRLLQPRGPRVQNLVIVSSDSEAGRQITERVISSTCAGPGALSCAEQ
jgi:hypothetical protein